MKVIFRSVLLFTVLCSTASFAQTDAFAAAAAACGPAWDHVKLTPPDPTKSTLTQPEPGKALVYVIEDDGVANRIFGASITWRIGLDGAWVGGMNRHNPYITISLVPGEHHLCANWQSSLGYLAKATSLALLDAQADKTYYFRVREWESQTVVFVDLLPVDSDQAKLLLALQPAVAHNQK